MRYTRIGFAAYAIAAVLVIVVVGVAWARSRSLPEPTSTAADEVASRPGAAPQESGAAAYQAECGGCHGAGEARGRGIPALRVHAVELLSSEAGRDYLIDFMLTGRVRSMQDGRASYDESHPSYAELTDGRIAAILNHMLASWGNEALLPAGARLYAPGDIASRR
jgi:cytochrome c5